MAPPFLATLLRKPITLGPSPIKDVCLLVAFALAASVAQTANAQITEATSATNESATRKSDMSAEAQARRARTSNQPGPFGVGAEVGVNPGGMLRIWRRFVPRAGAHYFF